MAVSSEDTNKSKAVLSTIRSEIVAGKLSPGDRLPNRVDLERRFGVSGITIHRALAKLIQDGFVEAAPGRGTFVAQRPPHLYQYGLVFRDNPQDIRFYQHIVNHSAALAEKGRIQFRIYSGIDGHTDVEDFQRLSRDVRAHRLAAMIFFNVDPYLFAGTPVLEERGITRVYHGDTTQAENVSFVHGHLRQWFEKALDYLRSRGRKRIAIISPVNWFQDIQPFLADALATRQMYCPPHWIQRPCSDLESTSACVQLMMHPDMAQRPDGMVIMHEPMADGVLAGLVASRIEIPQSLEVVAHCDFPARGPAIVPIKRLGYNSKEFLDTFLSVIERQSNSKTPSTTIVAPRFENELPLETDRFQD